MDLVPPPSTLSIRLSLTPSLPRPSTLPLSLAFPRSPCPHADTEGARRVRDGSILYLLPQSISSIQPHPTLLLALYLTHSRYLSTSTRTSL
jgi:hypothetical protein